MGGGAGRLDQHVPHVILRPLKEGQRLAFLSWAEEQCSEVYVSSLLSGKSTLQVSIGCLARYFSSGMSFCFVLTRPNPKSLFSNTLHKIVTLLRHLEGSHKLNTITLRKRGGYWWAVTSKQGKEKKLLGKEEQKLFLNPLCDYVTKCRRRTELYFQVCDLFTNINCILECARMCSSSNQPIV